VTFWSWLAVVEVGLARVAVVQAAAELAGWFIYLLNHFHQIITR
jgi:hypothetical protein